MNITIVHPGRVVMLLKSVADRFAFIRFGLLPAD